MSLKPSEVCAILQISKWTLRRIVRRGELDPIRISVRTWRFDAEDVDAYRVKMKLAPAETATA